MKASDIAQSHQLLAVWPEKMHLVTLKHGLPISSNASNTNLAQANAGYVQHS